MGRNSYEDEYIRRLEKVQDYIEEHIGESFQIEKLADEAGFSKYHFSRIFQSIMHEPLAHYVNRIRMERAKFFLAHRWDMNMTDICFTLGYTDSSVFSRAFKNNYNMSPATYRKEYSKNCQDSIYLSDYNKDIDKKERINRGYPVAGTISIEEIEKQQIAYVRHTGTYENLAKEYGRLINVLFARAGKQNLIREGKNRVLAIYHDNPEFTDAVKFRTSLCLTLPEGVCGHEDEMMGISVIEGGKYAVGHFMVTAEEFPYAWNYMYREWLTCSGYVPRNSSPFEVYLNNPSEDEERCMKVDLYLPIEPFLL